MILRAQLRPCRGIMRPLRVHLLVTQWQRCDCLYLLRTPIRPQHDVLSDPAHHGSPDPNDPLAGSAGPFGHRGHVSERLIST